MASHREALEAMRGMNGRIIESVKWVAALGATQADSSGDPGWTCHGRWCSEKQGILVQLSLPQPIGGLCVWQPADIPRYRSDA